MGNSACYSNISSAYTTKSNAKNAPTQVDNFIIQLHNYQRTNDIINNISQQQIVSDQRRTVFVSLLGLYQTYLLCPAPILYSAICILPIPKAWIYHSEQYKYEINNSILKTLTIFQNSEEWNRFVCLLKWKDRQNLVIWTDDSSHEISYNDGLVSEFWINFSNTLTELYDPITKSTYNPIKFDRKWWQFKYNLSQSKYKIPKYKILKELFFSTKEFKSMMEIICQSNPSLNPIISYQPPIKPNQSVVFEHLNNKSLQNGFVNLHKNQIDTNGFVVMKDEILCADIIIDENEDMDLNNDEGEWVISIDYNEYDIY